MEFKRIEKEIKYLEQNSNVDCLEYNGKELLKELKLALSICSSSLKLKSDTKTSFENWKKDNKFKMTEHGYFKEGIHYMVTDCVNLYLKDIHQL